MTSSSPDEHQRIHQPEPAAGYIGAILLMAVATVQWLAIVSVVLWMVPRMEGIYADFGSKLPTITVAVLEGRLVIAGLGVLIIAGMLLGLIVRPRSSVLMGINILMFIAGFVVIGLVIFALFAPLPGLIDAVQNN